MLLYLSPVQNGVYSSDQKTSTVKIFYSSASFCAVKQKYLEDPIPTAACCAGHV
jgi:hypothetical protein